MQLLDVLRNLRTCVAQRRDFAPEQLGGAFEPSARLVGDLSQLDDAGLDAEVFAEMAAHALAEQLLPAVAVLGQRGISVLFLQRGDVRVGLLVRVIHTSR